MEPNLNDFRHHQHHRHVSTQQPYLIHTNGLLSPPSTSATDGGVGNHVLFSPPQMLSPAAAAAASSAIPAKRRGRPRKYGTPEEALAARKAYAAAPPTLKDRKEKALLQLQRQGGVGISDCGGGDGRRGYLSKNLMTQLSCTGDAGSGFVPHVIAVAAGDDVAQKVMEFTQQSKREICILSASGSISTVSLRQPATTGGTITYGGQFEIITLSGSYIRTNLGGMTGGLSVCLSSPDGQIIGGGVGGPLMADGPVQVIIGSFIFDTKKVHSDAITNMVPSKLPPPIPSVDEAPSWFILDHTQETHGFLIEPVDCQQKCVGTAGRLLGEAVILTRVLPFLHQKLN